MLAILDIIHRGLRGRAADALVDRNAIMLIEQRVREAEASLSGGKDALASLIVRQRRETASLREVEARMADLEARTVSAMKAGDEKLAASAAHTIAELEREAEARRSSVLRLETRIGQLRLSIERASRRVAQLRQGAADARSAQCERTAQARFSDLDAGADTEAEALIARVLDGDDPFELGEVRREIDRDLSGETVADRLAERGHGSPRKTDGTAVLERLRARAQTTQA